MDSHKIIKIGNAQAFWGDQPRAPFELAQQQPDLDYLTLDYLSEVSLSIMAIQREKDPEKGYAQDFVEVIRSLIPLWKKGRKLKVIANAGGLNPQGCGMACLFLLQKESCSPLKIAVISGDSVLGILQAETENPLFNNLDSGQAIQTVADKLVTANAYLGAKPIAEALCNGADIVITGRVADPSLTVGPCVAEFGWDWTDYDRLASATVAGHLIECGTQVTGGISTNWMELQDTPPIGFPVIEMSADGSFVITKPEGTGGCVSIETVKEQLLYELGDPDNYLSPDVTVSFLSLQLSEEALHRIKVAGAKGKPPPNNYKISATYQNGYKTEAFLAVFGEGAREKAQRCGKIIIDKVKAAGYDLHRYSIECLGGGDVVPGIFLSPPSQQRECLLRIAAADPSREALECLGTLIAPMVTCGPPGTTGYTSGRPHVRKVFGYWPCLIPASRVSPFVEYIHVYNKDS